MASAVLAVTTLAAWLGLHFVPLPPALFKPPPAQRQFTDRNGLPLRSVLSSNGSFIQPVPYSQIPQPLIQATIAAEDKRFWNHPGVDWRATLRAGWGLLRYRHIVSGASTITQQLIKLTRPRSRTFRAKLIEAVQALRLEEVWDKQRIMAEYLNRIDYGNLNTGCAAAAEFYFATPLHDLSTAECALLAGLPQAPTRLNPLTQPLRARNRRQWILQRMRDDGFLTNDELERASLEQLRLVKARRSFEAAHCIDLLLTQTASEGPPNSIRTTLDLNLNRFVEGIIRRQLARLAQQHVSNAAAVVLDNASCEVLALVGSEDYFAPRNGQVNGAWAPRSAGSTFKPFTYAIAFEQGSTPATIVADVPTEFATATGLFAPLNYDRHCHGPMRYRLALANSLNIPAVRVLASLGGPAVLQQRLQACGLTTLTNAPEYYGLGLTIGNAEARLLELANAYACLARLGRYGPYVLLKTTSSPPTGQIVFDRAACFLLADILSDNAARALEFGPESNLRFDFPVACKTGTSSDFRDNWAFGYTPEFTVGVWVGNFDGTPMQGISGVTGAAPIMHEIMEHLHEEFGTSWYSTPTNIVTVPIDPLTGKQLGRLSKKDAVLEKFIADRLPPQKNSEDYDADGRLRLSAEYRAWFDSCDNSLSSRAVVEDTGSKLRILFPLPGTTIYLDPDLPDGGNRIHLQADGPRGIQWSSDTLKCRAESGQSYATLVPGHHRLTAREPLTGQRSETWVEVLQR